MIVNTEHWQKSTYVYIPIQDEYSSGTPRMDRMFRGHGSIVEKAEAFHGV